MLIDGMILIEYIYFHINDVVFFCRREGKEIFQVFFISRSKTRSRALEYFFQIRATEKIYFRCKENTSCDLLQRKYFIYSFYSRLEHERVNYLVEEMKNLQISTAFYQFNVST